jgi:general secretion pathway protein G
MTVRTRNLAPKRQRPGAPAGFTLIEILLVIVIIMMLAAALVVFVLPQQAGAEKNTTKLMLMQVQTALDTYRMNVGHYPTADEGGLGALLVKPQFANDDNGQLAERWQGPYLKPGTKLLDAWGHQVVYEPQDPSTTGLTDQTNALPYTLYSDGPDGQPNTDDDIKVNTSTDQNADSTSVLNGNNNGDNGASPQQ